MSEQSKSLSPNKPPLVLYLIAVFYLLPVVLPLGYFGDSFVTALYLLSFPLLFAILSIWALFRPNRILRWFPFASPLIGIIAIVLIITVVAPWASRTETSDSGWIGPLILLIYFFIFTVPTLIGAAILLSITAARKHVFSSMLPVSPCNTAFESPPDTGPSPDEGTGEEG